MNTIICILVNLCMFVVAWFGVIGGEPHAQNIYKAIIVLDFLCAVLLIVLVPLWALCEPKPADIEKASKRSKVRKYISASGNVAAMVAAAYAGWLWWMIAQAAAWWMQEFAYGMLAGLHKQMIKPEQPATPKAHARN